jgi:hypothetical protein
VVKNRSATIPLKTSSSLPYDCSISVVSEEPAARIEFDDLVSLSSPSPLVSEPFHSLLFSSDFLTLSTLCRRPTMRSGRRGDAGRSTRSATSGGSSSLRSPYGAAGTSSPLPRSTRPTTPRKAKYRTKPMTTPPVPLYRSFRLPRIKASEALRSSFVAWCSNGAGAASQQPNLRSAF